MRDDVFAIEHFVIDHRVAVLAEEDEVFRLALGTTTLDNKAERVRSALRRVRDIGRNEKDFALFDRMRVHLAILNRLHGDVALKLNEKLLAVDLVEIVARVGSRDDHHEEITARIEVLVAHGWHHLVAIRANPGHQIERFAHAAVGFKAIEFAWSVGVRDRAN